MSSDRRPGLAPVFTEEHEMFRQSVRSFVETHMTPHADAWEESERFPDELFKACAGEDLLGISAPREQGGLGLDYWYSVVFIEELQRSRCAGANMAIMVQTDMATPVIAALGTEAQKQTFLAPAIRGEKIAALGVSEPNAGSDVAGIRTTAVRDGDEWVINGSKTFITNGTRADFITLLVKTDVEAGHRGVSMILFPTDTPGFTIGRTLKKLGNKASDTAELFFEDCRVPAANLLGEENKGFYYMMTYFQRERLVSAISAMAAARYWLDETVRYARERKVYGRPLVTFEHWRQELAQLATEIEAAKRLTYHAVDLFDRGQECVREVSMAKMFSGEVANKVADRCLQLHGGWGYMDEYGISRAWRDLRLLTIGAGTSEVMREIIAKREGF